MATYHQKTLRNQQFKAKNYDNDIQIIGRILEVHEKENIIYCFIKPNNSAGNFDGVIFGNIYASITKQKKKIEINDFVCLEGLIIEDNIEKAEFVNYLRQKNCGLFFKTRKVQHISPSDSPFFWNFINKTRGYCQKIFSKYLSGQKLALAQAIFIGEKKNLSYETNNSFQVSGLMHILAISGLHVGIFVSTFYYFLQAIGLSPVNRSIFIIIFLIFFIFFTGASPSVIRASFMAIWILFYRLMGRGTDILASLSSVGFIMLASNPYLIFQTSFQLSFCAILSLIFIYPFLNNIVVSFYPRMKYIIISTLSVQLGLTPFLINYFHAYSITSVFSNLIVLPTLPCLLITLVLGITGGILSESFAGLFFSAQKFLLDYILFVCSITSKIPGAEIKIVNISLLCSGVYYLLLFCIFVYLHRLNKRYSVSFLIMLIVGLITVNIWFGWCKSHPPSSIEVTFLDIGQGDSILIRTPEGLNVLVDGGPSDFKLEDKLNRKGITKLDLVVLTHPHSDHFEGLKLLVERYKLGQVFFPSHVYRNKDFLFFKETIERKKISNTKVFKGDSFTFGKLFIQVLNPPNEKIQSDSLENDNSLVLKVTYQEFEVLLTGDIEEEGILSLLNNNYDLEADVLKVPHHGGSTSVFEELLENIKPKIAVISVGKYNDFGHPSKQTISLLAEYSKIYRTDTSGNVKIASDGIDFWVEEEEKSFNESKRIKTGLSFSGK